MKKIIFLIAIAIYLQLFSQVTLDPRYHTNEEIYDEIMELQEQYPDIMMVQQIGITNGADPYCEPMPVWGVKISDNVTVDEDEPAVMFAGQCHAEEVLGVEITMFMINDILEHRFQLPYVYWISELETWLVPTYNPEGLDIVMSGLDDSWRKNQRDNNLNGILDIGPGPGGDSDGVDTNRNYSFNWIHGDSLYAMGSEEWNDYYRGPGPFSEGGSRAIRDLADEQHFIYSINWHSSRTGNFSEKVFYSFEWEGEKRCPDFLLNQAIGESVAGLIETEDGTAYYEPSASHGRKGSAHDWFYKAHGTTQLLIECGTQNLQPPNEPPYYLVDDTCERGSNGAYWLLNRAIGYNTDSASMLTGHITDAVTGDPLVAEIIVQEKHASYFEPRVSDELYGRFWRVLNPGTYDLTIRKKGYEIQEINDVTVNNSVWTTREIQLVPLEEVTITGNITCNGNQVDAEMIVFGIENDTLNIENGSFEYNGLEGEFTVRITAAGCVPHLYTETLSSGNFQMDFNLEPEISIFSEDWNNGFSNWEVTGSWTIDSNNEMDYVTDSPDIFYENSSSAILTTINPINLGGVSDDVVLSFQQKYHTEHDNDLCLVEISTNGFDWNELARFSGFDKEWHRVVIPLSDFTDSFISLRFNLTTDETITDPGWWLGNIKIVASIGAEADEPELPILTKLHGNFPNPFKSFTTISFNVSHKEVQNAKIKFFNLKGQKVKTIPVNQDDSSSRYLSRSLSRVEGTILWDGKDDQNNRVSSGIYFYKLETDNFENTKKMLIIK